MAKPRRSTEFGRRIAEARRRRGFARAVLAAYVPISEATLGSWEAGNSRPNPTQLVRLAQGLGVAQALLCDGGVEWATWVRGAGRLISPHVFDVPTQYPGALSHDIAEVPVLLSPADRAAPEPAPKTRSRWKRTEARAAVVPARAPAPSNYLGFSLVGPCRICKAPGIYLIGICAPCWRGEE